MRSRVVVGRPATPTPELPSSMDAVKFNPSWTPTPSMVRNEGVRFVPPGPNNSLGYTRFPDQDGRIVTYPDVYGRSQAVQRREPVNEATLRGNCHGPLEAAVSSRAI